MKNLLANAQEKYSFSQLGKVNNYISLWDVIYGNMSNKKIARNHMNDDNLIENDKDKNWKFI